MNKSIQILRHAIDQSGFSLREVGRRAGTSHATLSAYLHGRKTPSVATLLRVVDACNFAIDWQLRPRVRESHGLSRGEELAQVLRLAEQFPSKPAKDPKFPRFPQHPLVVSDGPA